MTQSFFFYKELTKAEIGKTGTHEIYVRLPNDFNYEEFFGSSGIMNGSVLEISFTANDITNGGSELTPLRFAYFKNSNHEKRIPSLGPLFKKHNVQKEDIVCLESRVNGLNRSYYIRFFKKGEIHISPSSFYFSKDGNEEIKEQEKTSQYQPLQQIFYGAPGTGKSFKIDEMTQKYPTIRTTFHPDSDYSTFVGAYKPIMEDIDVKVTPVVVENGISLQPSGTYKERRIAYKFVKQAFLKAYLGAWKKYVDRGTVTSIPLCNTFNINNNEYTIIEINDTEISCRRVFPFDIRHISVSNAWNEIWASGSFVMPTGSQSGKSVEQAIAQWIKDNLPNCTSQSLEDGLNKLQDSITDRGKISVIRSSQTYDLTKREGVIFAETKSTSKKTTLKDYYDGKEPDSGAKLLLKKFASMLREIDETSFENAWACLSNAINNKTNMVDLQHEKSVLVPQFLIIEEINRGNCAQIFGDIFQLLDRSDNGFSTYPIEADTDLQQEVSRAFKEDKEYKLLSNIEIEGKVKNYTSNYGANLSEDVQEGRVLLFPPNLYIWATMNTSDQSLFPIDSAFKRRWDWKYIPIKNHEEKDFKIDISGTIYSWWGFLEKINNVIGKVTSSEDKKLGYFFVKANGKDIDATKFVGKVLFYLWNDVFKNYGFDNTIFSRAENKKFEFSDFFDKNGEPETTVVNEFLKKLDETIDKDNSFIIKKSNDTVSSEEESSDEDNEQQEG